MTEPTGMSDASGHNGAPGDAIRVLIVDDEPLARSGLRAIVDFEPDLEVVGEAADGVAAVDSVRRLTPDVVLMDVRMPRVDGISAIGLLDRLDDPPAVLIVTTFENDGAVYDALRAGARGFLLKRARPEEFVDAIRVVHRGDSLLFPTAIATLAATYGADGGSGGDGLGSAGLTEREEEVLRLIARGMSNAEIAGELFLGVETIKTHVKNVIAKLGVRDRVQAVIAAYESGFIPIPRARP